MNDITRYLTKGELEELRQRAIREVTENPDLTAEEKLRRKAKINRDFREAVGQPSVVYGRADRTGVGRAFAVSAARTAGRSLVRAIFRNLFRR